MGILSYIFGRKTRPVDDKTKPPIFGGTGSSHHDAVIINCASMAMCNKLINQFITENNGEMAKDWNRAMEYFVNSPDVPEHTIIRCVSIERKDETTTSYYFDVSRPMA
jgi:hypothetical protein